MQGRDRLYQILKDREMKEEKNKYESRRGFVKIFGKLLAVVPLAGLPVLLSKNTSLKGYVWQIDPYKCIACGECKTACILTPSASKCVHEHALCGYCDLCGGYLKEGAKSIGTGAEVQMCPVGAITRKYVEEPFFEYTIDEDLCDGCAKCVKGCKDFGNGSLYMQIKQDICVNCNECSIAVNCPAQAVSRMPADNQYIHKSRPV